MDIGIIGAGHIGGTLTRRLTQLGHTVKVANSRAPETLADLAAETGATAVWARDAATDADLVIVSIPQKNVPDLADGIVDARKPGAPVIEKCTGCTAVRRVDGSRVRRVRRRTGSAVSA